MAKWLRDMTSHKQILLDIVLYSSVKQQKKHWGTRILWAKKGTIICPMEINIFAVLNKKKSMTNDRKIPLRSTKKGQKGAEDQ